MYKLGTWDETDSEELSVDEIDNDKFRQNVSFINNLKGKITKSKYRKNYGPD